MKRIPWDELSNEPDDPTPAEQETAWQRLEAAMHTEHVEVRHAGANDGATWQSGSVWMRRLSLVAGVGVALALVSSVVLFRGLGTTRVSKSSAHVSGRRYATAIGQRATITLRDGTRVTLAPRTTLVVPDHFGVRTRTVALVGEAQFDVQTHTGDPFTVRTGAVTTRVLGTTFDVRHYLDDRNVRIAVATGKVMVFSARATLPSMALASGWVGLVTDSTTTSAQADDITTYSAWTDGRLIFSGASVADVLTTVGRWYGYEFRLTDSTLAARHVSLALEHRSAAEALEAIKTVLNVSMTFDGRIVTLRPLHKTIPPNRTRQAAQDSFHTTTEIGR